MSKPHLLIAEPNHFSPCALASLSAWADVTLLEVEPIEFRRAFRQQDIIWFRLGHNVTAEHLTPGQRCRLLATPVTGLDHIDLDACARSNVQVVSLRGETEFLRHIRGTAELTVALALTLMRRIPAAAESVRKGNWVRDRFQGTELYGKTGGIVGMGRLGTIVGGYLRTFGMSVIGHDPRPDFPSVGVERVSSLKALLQRSDLITLHVSYSRKTRRLIDDEALCHVKKDAALINTSRGGVVDEGALLKALQSGRLAGAALDVLDGEPIAGSWHPLVAYARTHDNLLITPHIGGNTRESFAKTEVFLAERVAEAWKKITRAR